MLKNIHIWLPGYIKSNLLMKRPSKQDYPVHIMFSLVDHFEPKRGNVGRELEEKRVDTWIEKYEQLATRHRDADNLHPRHSIFYPQEEYETGHLEKLTALCEKGFGEVEIHLHHDNDTAEKLRHKIRVYKEKLIRHNLLSRDEKGEVRYAFIHGNWALDNSRKDGRWCGVNNELEVLRDTGCYADFTLPSAPSDTQTVKINSIYYAKDTPEPKSHNRGIDVEVDKTPSGDLMIIQGPLALNWRKRKFGIIPRIENSDISYNNPPTSRRVDLWVNQSISIIGKPDWLFVKVHTHGLWDDNLKDEHFKNLGIMFDYLGKRYNDGIKYKLHYVTAREMYNIIKAGEAGEGGDPCGCRDYLLKGVGVRV